MSYKYLIIGGGVAGTTAAETIRANDKDGSIAIVSDEPHLFYSRIMLSKPSFLLDEEHADKVWLKTPEWYKDNHIEFFGGKSVTALDAVAKTVTIDGGEVISYEKLLLAIGVHARKWTVPGTDKKGVYYLRTLDEAKEFAAAMKQSKRAVVIGSSCVAFETIENLIMDHIEVNEVMLEKYFWEPMLDEEGGRIVEAALAKAGVKFFRQTETAEVIGGESVEGIVTKDGQKIDCDMISCGIGVVYPVEFVKAAGIKVNRGIAVNEYLETSAADVWAAGDVAEYSDIVLEEPCMSGNWMNAREQGRIAALGMAGKKQPFRLVSFYTSRGFGLNIAFSGDIRMLPDRTAIGRSSADGASHTRFILHEGKIVGVTMVNGIQELGIIVKLIENRTDVSVAQKELSDPGYDLKQLVVSA
jgi:3-phenylpropionate/trans-cinnamate dioxygenase ferredoxin reductase component